MGIEELGQNVQQTAIVAQLKTPLRYGVEDTVLRIAEGSAPEATERDHLFIALDGDSFRPRLGTFDLREREDGSARMFLRAEETLREHPEFIGVVAQEAMLRTGVNTIIVRPETDTNLGPAGPEVIRLAGAVALSNQEFAFRAPAA